jgi:hypothetical protein
MTTKPTNPKTTISKTLAFFVKVLLIKPKNQNLIALPN